MKGYNKRMLYRMLELYETYKNDQIVTPLVTQIGWTQHVIIMTRAKTPEERLFYIEKCISAPCSMVLVVCAAEMQQLLRNVQRNG